MWRYGGSSSRRGRSRVARRPSPLRRLARRVTSHRVGQRQREACRSQSQNPQRSYHQRRYGSFRRWGGRNTSRVCQCRSGREVSDPEPLHDIRWYLIAVGDPPYALGAEGTFLMPEGDYAVFALYGDARDRVQVHVGAPPQATARPTSRPAPVATRAPQATATTSPPTATTDPNAGTLPTPTATVTQTVTDGSTPSGPSEVFVDGSSELGPVMAAIAAEFQVANSGGHRRGGDRREPMPVSNCCATGRLTSSVRRDRFKGQRFRYVTITALSGLSSR